MHNGNIADFPLFKRRLQADLPDDIFATVKGNTDSEWSFALLLSKVRYLPSNHNPLIELSLQIPDPKSRSFSPEILRKAMLDTIASPNKYAEDVGVTEPSLMNFCVTDGSSIVVTRYISSRKDEAASLV